MVYQTVMSLGEIIRNQEKSQDEEENVIYIDSFFIPHVFDHVSLDQLVDIIEKSDHYKGEGDTSIGIVEKIEAIPKIHEKDGHSYYSCFVSLKSWANTDYSRKLMFSLYNDEQTRVYYKANDYGKASYIVLMPNKSEISMAETPKHSDLVLYLHSDTTYETVLNVIEGLDIGKVHSIEMERVLPITNSPNVDKINVPCEWVNPEMWSRKVCPTYNIVFVRMEYWYKTQTAYSFKQVMNDSTFVELNVFEGTTWTIYETAPKFEGINPYVLMK